MASSMKRALRTIEQNQREFHPNFKAWLGENFPIYLEFENQARLISTVRDHYSSRTIIESIRHESTHRERLGGKPTAFKINNNAVPEVGRLFALLNPTLKHLPFQHRNTRSRITGRWKGR